MWVTGWDGKGSGRKVGEGNVAAFSPRYGRGERCATPYLQSTLIRTMDWRWSFDAPSGLGAKLAEVL